MTWGEALEQAILWAKGANKAMEGLEPHYDELLQHATICGVLAQAWAAIARELREGGDADAN